MSEGLLIGDCSAEQKLVLQLLTRVEALEKEADARDWKPKPELIHTQEARRSFLIKLSVWDDAWTERGYMEDVPGPVVALLQHLDSVLQYTNIDIVFQHVHHTASMAWGRDAIVHNCKDLPGAEAAAVLRSFDNPLRRIRQVEGVLSSEHTGLTSDTLACAIEAAWEGMLVRDGCDRFGPNSELSAKAYKILGTVHITNSFVEAVPCPRGLFAMMEYISCRDPSSACMVSMYARTNAPRESPANIDKLDCLLAKQDPYKLLQKAWEAEEMIEQLHLNGEFAEGLSHPLVHDY